MAILAGILYNSWPLGFFLNPRVSLGGGLASELEGLNQPYNWFFVLLDIVAGALVLAVVIMLWRKHISRFNKLALISFALFGFFTILDALLPMPCAPSIAYCASWTHEPLLVLHGIADIGGAVFLFVAALIVWHLRRVHHGVVVMRILLTGWAVVGLLSLYFFFMPGPSYLSQDYYLLLCGIWVGVMPALFQLEAVKQRKLAPQRVRARP